MDYERRLWTAVFLANEEEVLLILNEGEQAIKSPYLMEEFRGYVRKLVRATSSKTFSFPGINSAIKNIAAAVELAHER